MKKKIVVLSNNNIFNVVVVAFCLFLLILMTTLITKQIFLYNDILKSKEYLEEIKEKYYTLPNAENLLYHIAFRSPENYTFSIKIDKDYNLTYNKHYGKISFQDILSENHYKTIYSTEEIKQIVNFLDNLDYSSIPEEFNLSDKYYKIQSFSNDFFETYNFYENIYLDFLIKSLVENDNNAINFFFLNNDNVTDYIIETDYKEININSYIVNELYNVINHDTLYESYKTNELDNNTKITLTIDNLINEGKNQLISEENKTDDSMSNEYIEISDFNEKYKSIFGNISYDLNNYHKYSISTPIYYYEDELIKIGYYFDIASEGLFKELAYAYQKDNNIYLVEKTLYFGTSSSLYESVDEKYEITDNFNEYNDIINEASKFATYYKHTFTLNDDGNYYYTDIDRLN